MRESSGSSKERVARRMLRLREGDVEHGIPIVPTRDRITFEDAAEDLLNDYRTNGKRSLKVCERRVKKHLAPFFRGRLLANITPSDIRAYTAKRQADVIIVRKARVVDHGDGRREEIPAVTKLVSNAEINRELTTLKRMFSLAVQADKLTRKPHIPMLQERNTRVGFFEPEQLDAVARPPARGDPAGDRVRRDHRLAHRVRGAAAGVAAGRHDGWRGPARRAHDEERRRPRVPVHRRISARC